MFYGILVINCIMFQTQHDLGLKDIKEFSVDQRISAHMSTLTLTDFSL